MINTKRKARMEKIESDYDDIVNGIDNNANHVDEDAELESVTSCSLVVEEEEDPKQEDVNQNPPLSTITTTAIPNNNQSMCTSVMNVLLGLTGGDADRYNSFLLDAVDDQEEDYYDDLQALQVNMANQLHSKYITRGIPFGWNNKTLLLEELGLFHEPLALEHQPLLCLAVLMRLTNLQYRPNNSLVEVFTQEEMQRIYQAVTQVLLAQQQNNNRKTRSHVCLQRMTYFVLKDYLLDAIIMEYDTTTMKDICMFHNNTAVIPQALRLLPTISKRESDPTKVEAAVDTVAQRMQKNNHNTSKALSALFVVAQQLLERYSALNSTTPSEPNSALAVLLENELSKATGGGMMYFHALQLRLWMDYGNAPPSEDTTKSHQQPANDEYLEYLRIVGANHPTRVMSPLSCILWIRYIERQLQQQSLPKETMDEYESFLASKLKQSSEMVVLEAARVAVDYPQTSTKVLEAAVSVLQTYTPTDKLEQRKINPVVRRQAARLLEHVGLRFLGQLGIS